MAVARSSWQAERRTLQKQQINHQRILKVDSWRKRQISSKDVRRASAKLNTFDDELKHAIALQRTEIQQIGQEAEAPIVRLDALTQVAVARDAQFSQKISSQVPAVDTRVGNLETSVGEHWMGDSGSTRLISRSQYVSSQGQSQQVESTKAKTRRAQASRDRSSSGSQDHSIQKTLRQSAWRTVPEWNGEYASVSRKEHTQPLANSHPTNSKARRLESQPTIGIPSSGRSASDVVVAPARFPEEAVYQYLKTHDQGACLPELESDLGISRFETVDALRSLIRRELVIQDNKTYYICQNPA